MNIRFWGVRGSIATPVNNATLTEKIETAVREGVKAGLTHEDQVPEFVSSLPWHIRNTAGGDTACVEIQAGDKILILDAGTGMRPLGMDLLQRFKGEPFESHILITHTHWDHVSGIPFFVPAFNPKNKLIIYGLHEDLEDRLRQQQDFIFFPVPLNPTFRFVHLELGKLFQIGDIEIETASLNHPGDCYAYRITYAGKTVVYATDSEYKELSTDALKPFTDFFHHAEVLIFDAQFTILENIEKEDWGHSNAFIGIDMAIKAGVKKLVFTHHDPAYSDYQLWEMLERARGYLSIYHPEERPEVYLATEGLSLTI
ncbi:MAG: hypothetical protein B6245_06245 [Desulfobacteraceae bacterium 4572_88]|nr:MAG: hypothetical protein B6245_06245 [Desulfobacteraceae bacterium 4572_88]